MARASAGPFLLQQLQILHFCKIFSQDATFMYDFNLLTFGHTCGYSNNEHL
jgi:hypothetical protein